MSWTVASDRMTREVRTSDFLTAFRLVEAMVPVAEALNHHPDLALGWGYVRITLTTHDAGGLTDKDRELARRLDGVLAAEGFTG